MIDSLRTLFKMFYAPRTAFAEARDRAPLIGAILFALVAQVAYQLYAQWAEVGRFIASPNGIFIVLNTMFDAAQAIIFVAVVFTLLILFVANLLERRGGFRLIVTQDYASLATTLLYAWTVAVVMALIFLVVLRVSGGEAAHVANQLEQWQTMPTETREAFGRFADMRLMLDGRWHRVMLAAMILIGLFVAWSIVAVREFFGVRLTRAALIIVLAGIGALVTSPVWGLMLALISALPLFLLLFIALAARGYFGQLVLARASRARFKQNLEASTLNPADASAHYNLGLIHLDRREYDDARTRFTRAVEIDADETDAHYQLGRIARTQGNHTEAITHFEQVVRRDEDHAQHEIWREIGATYLAANQPEDARTALERFLENRTSDPEGLYLMGRALAEMNRTREAIDVMRRCVEAVKSAPAYKYRTDKRWMNEAQSFLRAQAQE